jgi:hypothetical protein
LNELDSNNRELYVTIEELSEIVNQDFVDGDKVYGITSKDGKKSTNPIEPLKSLIGKENPLPHQKNLQDLCLFLKDYEPRFPYAMKALLIEGEFDCPENFTFIDVISSFLLIHRLQGFLRDSETT